MSHTMNSLVAGIANDSCVDYNRARRIRDTFTAKFRGK
jgi:hypothetical protein